MSWLDRAIEVSIDEEERKPSWLVNAVEVDEPKQDDERKPSWLVNAVEVEALEEPKPSWLVNAVEVEDPAQSYSDILYQEHEAYQPEPKKSFLSFNLRKALLNQGVDPDTMEVVRPVQEMGFFEKVVRSFKGGDARMKMDWRMAEAAASDEDVFEQYRKEELLYERALAMNPIAQNQTHSIWEKAFFGAADSLAGMMYSWTDKAITGGLIAAAFATPFIPGPVDEVAVGGALITRLLGPQAAARIFGRGAIASAVLKYGPLVGGASPYYLQGKGDLYRDMRNMGVDHETAKLTSTVGAAPYAAIEFINEFVPFGSVLGRMFPRIAGSAKPVVSKSISEALRKFGSHYIKATLAESTEEFFQELNNEVFKNIAAELGGVPEEKANAWQMLTQSTDAFVQAIGPSAVLGFIPSAQFGARQVNTSRIYNSIQNIYALEHGEPMGDVAATYITASFTGQDFNKLKGTMDLTSQEQMAELGRMVARTSPNLFKTLESMRERGKLSPEAYLEIATSKSPNIALDVFLTEGMDVLKQFNEALHGMPEAKVLKTDIETPVTAEPEPIAAEPEPVVEPTPTVEIEAEVKPHPELTTEDVAKPAHQYAKKYNSLTEAEKVNKDNIGFVRSLEIPKDRKGRHIGPAPGGKFWALQGAHDLQDTPGLHMSAGDAFEHFDVFMRNAEDNRSKWEQITELPTEFKSEFLEDSEGRLYKSVSPYMPEFYLIDKAKKVEAQASEAMPTIESTYGKQAPVIKEAISLINEGKPNELRELYLESNKFPFSIDVADNSPQGLFHSDIKDIIVGVTSKHKGGAVLNAEVVEQLGLNLEQYGFIKEGDTYVHETREATLESVADLKKKAELERAEPPLVATEPAPELEPAAAEQPARPLSSMASAPNMPPKIWRMGDETFIAGETVEQTPDGREQLLMTPVKFDEGDWVYDEAGEPIYLDAVPADAEPVHAELTDRAVLDKAYAEYESTADEALERLREKLEKLSFEPAVANALSDETKARLAEIGVIKDSEETTKAIDKLATEVEGMLVDRHKDSPRIILGKDANTFTTVHEVFQYLWGTTLRNVDYFKNGVNAYFDWLGDAQDKFVKQWRKSENGKTIMADIEAWRASGKENLSTAMEEMLTRAVELTYAKMSETEGTYKKTKRSFVTEGLRIFYDSMPEQVKAVFRKIADTLAITWRKIQSIRPKEQSGLYKMATLPINKATENHLRQLAYFNNFKNQHQELVTTLTERASTALERRRNEMKNSLLALHKEGKLTYIKGTNTEVIQQIDGIVDTNIKLMTDMFVNSALMEAHDKQAGIVTELVKNTAKHAVAPTQRFVAPDMPKRQSKTFLGALASKIAYWNSLSKAFRSANTDQNTAFASRESFANMLENYWREVAIPEFYAQAIAERIMRDTNPNEVMTNEKFESEVLRNLSTALAPQVLRDILVIGESEGMFKAMINKGIVLDRQDLRTSRTTAGAIYRYFNSDPKTMTPDNLNIKAAETAPVTEAVQSSEKVAVMNEVRRSLADSILDDILFGETPAEPIIKKLNDTKTPLVVLTEALKNRLIDLQEMAAAGEVYSDDVDLARANLAKILKQVASAEDRTEAVQESRRKAKPEIIEQQFKVKADELVEPIRSAVNEVNASDPNIGTLETMSIDMLMSEGANVIAGKSDAEAIKLIRNITVPYKRLAAVIALANRAAASGDKSISFMVARELSLASRNFGRLGQMLQQVYTTTEAGRQLLIDSTDELMRKRTRKDTDAKRKNFERKIEAILEKGAQNLTEQDVEYILKNSIKDTQTKRTTRERTTRTMDGAINAAIAGEIRGSLLTDLRRIMANITADEDVPFYSRRTKPNQSKFDLTSATHEILTTMLENDILSFANPDDKLINSVMAELANRYPETKGWASEHKGKARKFVSEAINATSAKVFTRISDISRRMGITVDEATEDFLAKDTVEEAERNSAADMLIDKIKAVISSKSGEIKFSKATAISFVNAIMDIVTEQALVKQGTKIKALNSFKAMEFLAQISNNEQVMQDILAEAQEQIESLGIKDPARIRDFVKFTMETPFAQRRVVSALKEYLNFINKKDYPRIIKAKIASGQANLLDSVLAFEIRGLDNLNNLETTMASDSIAKSFAAHLIEHYDFNPEFAESLKESVEEQIGLWLRPAVETKINIEKETATVVRNIINEVNKSDFNPVSHDGVIASQILTALRTFGVVPKSVSGQADAVFKKLGIVAVNQFDTQQAMANAIANIEASINDALASEKQTPETLRTIAKLNAVLTAISESSDLKEFGKYPVLNSRIDSAINRMLKVYSDISAFNASRMTGVLNQKAITMRTMAGWTREHSKYVMKNIVEGILKQTGIKDGHYRSQLEMALSDRMLERLENAQRERLMSLLKTSEQPPAKVDFADRIIDRVFTGALEDSETADALARYIGFGGMTTDQRLKLLQYSRSIEKRGEVVNRAYAERMKLDPEKPLASEGDAGTIFVDQWRNSNEYRLMLKEFGRQLANVAGHTTMDKATAWYFSFMLSGLSTQEVNISSTGFHSFMHTMSQAWATHILDSEGTGVKFNWSAYLRAMSDWGRGLRQSLPVSMHLLATGDPLGPGISEYASSARHIPNVGTGMFGKVLGKILGPFKHGIYALSAMDLAMANANVTALAMMESRTQAIRLLGNNASAADIELATKVISSAMLRRNSRYDLTKQADRQALKSDLEKVAGKATDTQAFYELAERVGVLEHFVDQAYFEVAGKEIDVDVEAYDAIKKLNALDRLKVFQRIDELQYNSLSPELRQELKRSAGEATYNYGDDQQLHPVYHHTIGKKIIRVMELARREIPALKFIVPFVRIVGQVTDMSLDYSPVGFYRAHDASFRMRTEQGSTITMRDVQTLRTKATFGTLSTLAVASAAVLSMLAKGKDDDDDDDKDWFQITGRGPSDRTKANAWRESGGYGFQEYSIRIGNKWYSYRYTPLAIPFVWLGGVMDYLRYTAELPKWHKMSAEERELFDRKWSKVGYKAIAHGSLNALPGMLEQTYMQSISDFLEVLSTPNEEVMKGKMARLIGKTAGTFISPNIAKQIYRTIDPSLYDTPETMNAVMGEMLRDVPMPPAWKGNMLLKRYNALGEPIRLNSPTILTSLIEIAVREGDNKPANIGRFVSIGRRTDPVWTFIAERDIRLPGVSRNEALLGLTMTDEVRQNYAVRRGQILRNVLEHAISRGAFDKMSDAQAQEMVTKISSSIGSIVKASMLTDRRVLLELVKTRRPEVWKRYGVYLPP